MSFYLLLPAFFYDSAVVCSKCRLVRIVQRVSQKLSADEGMAH